jgi:hypothetical protein
MILFYTQYNILIILLRLFNIATTPKVQWGSDFVVTQNCSQPPYFRYRKGRNFLSRIFHVLNPSSRFVALVSTQPLTEVGNVDLPWG